MASGGVHRARAGLSRRRVRRGMDLATGSVLLGFVGTLAVHGP